MAVKVDPLSGRVNDSSIVARATTSTSLGLACHTTVTPVAVTTHIHSVAVALVETLTLLFPLHSSNRQLAPAACGEKRFLVHE